MAERKRKLAPVHPGEILREDFMVPLGLSINALTRALRTPPNHVSGIVNEKRGVSAKMALRLIGPLFPNIARVVAGIAAGL